MADELLTRAEVAAILKVKVETLEVWASTDRYDLPMVKIGSRCVRYRRSDVERFIESRSPKSLGRKRTPKQ